MARVKAFCGIYYQEQAGRISDLVAPPYDVLSVEEANWYREQNPYNVVHITVSRKGEASFYLRANELFTDWLQRGILARSKKPGIYFYETEFEYQLGGASRRAVRRGFFALLGLADYSQGEVLRHERTLKGPKLDQFNLLSATWANLSPIFCLYPDPGLKLIQALAEAKKQEPVFDFEFRGSRHRLFGIYDQKLIGLVSQALAKERVYIADGHHRYETALDFYHRLKFGKDPREESAGYLMSYFCPVEEPGLVIFPYHRLIRHLPEERLRGLEERLKEDFLIERIPESISSANVGGVFQKLDAVGEERALILINEQRQAFLLRLKPELKAEMEHLLDVEMVEDLILKRLLRISKEELSENKYVSYETSEEKLVGRIEKESFQLIFLLKPIRVGEMVARANAGQVLPEKSTYFYPKVLSGMLFRKIESGAELS